MAASPQAAAAGRHVLGRGGLAARVQQPRRQQRHRRRGLGGGALRGVKPLKGWA